MTIPAAFIQELVARADVVEIIGRSVTLKKAGANFVGLCPFHSEKSPSFSVSPAKQFYHCFGCGAHGNVIGFLMEQAGMGFVDAVTELAGQYGLQVPQEHASPEQQARDAKQRERRSTLAGVLAKAGEGYRAQLRTSPRAIDYLKGRGLSGAIVRDFGIGYAPPGWRTLAGIFPDYADPLLVESGLVIGDEPAPGNEPAADAPPREQAKRYDRFRDRIMFPIRNVRGEVIGFGGRVLGDEKPKYLNSPETPVFSKGHELYGLFEARTAIRERGYALVTEGYMDVVALAQLGFPQAVATLGTACTPEHVQKLFRFTDAVVFSFDGDAAGRRAARKALEAALPYAGDLRSIRFLFLPAEHDPDSFIRAEGAEASNVRCRPPCRSAVSCWTRPPRAPTSPPPRGAPGWRASGPPLWDALPDGALKRQLLGEIAQAVQLDLSELAGLWGLNRRSRPPERRAAVPDGSPPGAPGTSYGRPVVRPRRAGPLGRAEIAARLLLSEAGDWEAIGHEMQELLCQQPGAVGALFVWLDSQLHEHGPQPWAALREGLRGQPFEDLALRLMEGPDGAFAATLAARDPAEARRELDNVLAFMLDERLKALQSEAIAAAATDPSALERYKALEMRRLALRARLQAPTSSS